MTDKINRLRAALAERYAIRREVGQGGMARVYLADDLKNHRAVAVKVLRSELTASIGPERFLREIDITANFNHPHILPLLDSGVADEFLYYVMPFIEGESLRARLIRDKQLQIKEAVDIACDVAVALGIAHDHDVVHRDIKPENILLHSGLAVVADFGIAKGISAAGGKEITDTGIAVGSPLYMSPEQASAEADIDGRSDVYSLGCVLYEMLAGEPPFTGPTSHSILARQISARPPSLRIVRPAIPVTIETAIEKALEKVPADRFQTAAEFAAALREPDSKPEVSRRRGASKGMLILVTLLLIAAVVRIVVPRRSTADPVRDPSSIAILYFEDLSIGQSLEHVAMGMTEELNDHLGAIGALSVVSSVGMRPFRGRDIPLDSIVSIFDVGTLVHGSVDSAGGRLQVTVRLIDADNFAQLDSESFEEDWAGIPELSGRLATEVSRFLRRRVGQEVRLMERRAQTQSVDAWDLVQRSEVLREDATYVSRAGDLETAFEMLLRADSMLARAETFDEDWLEPTILRGWLVWELGRNSPQNLPRAGAGGSVDFEPESGMSYWLGIGLDHAQRAFDKSPGLPAALELRGALRYFYANYAGPEHAEAYMAGAEQDLRTAVGEDPSRARAWEHLSLVLQFRGGFAEAATAAERALEADAYLTAAPAILQVLIFASLETGQFGNATYWCAEGHRRFPNDRRLVHCRLFILGWSGGEPAHVDEAWQSLHDIEDGDSIGLYDDAWAIRRFMVAAVLARVGLGDSARLVVRQANSRETDQELSDNSFYEAYVRTLLDERDLALELLSQFLAGSPLSAGYIERHRWFRSLHEDERFQELIARYSG